MLEEWNIVKLCPIIKKGDMLSLTKYKGISLWDMCYKILSTFFLKRITPYTENIIRRYQCGFRKSKFTINQIFTKTNNGETLQIR